MSLVEHAGKILIVSLVVLSVVVIFISFVHQYVKWFWYRPPNIRPRRRRGDFTAGYQTGVTVIRRGLDPSFLKTLAVIPFDPKHFNEEGLECAVCLSEVGEGERTRILPKCNHGFHVECIDMWFYSHSTCPICRNPVSASVEAQVSVENLLEEAAEEGGDFPANMLFWGDETQVSTLTSQAPASTSSSSSAAAAAQMVTPDLVIDIPLSSQIDCDAQKTPVSSRLRRILSGSRRFINNPFSSAPEQGHHP